MKKETTPVSAPATTTGIAGIPVPVIVLIVLLLLGGGWFLFSKKKTTAPDASKGSGTDASSASSGTGIGSGPSSMTTGQVVNKANQIVGQAGGIIISKGTPVVSNNSSNIQAVANNPVDPAAIVLRKQNTAGYQAWSNNVPAATYNPYWNSIISVYGDTRSAADVKNGTPNYNEGYVSGFLKGMNLLQSQANLNAFKSYIDEYMASPGKMFHWNVTTGQFLN